MDFRSDLGTSWLVVQSVVLGGPGWAAAAGRQAGEKICRIPVDIKMPSAITGTPRISLPRGVKTWNLRHLSSSTLGWRLTEKLSSLDDMADEFSRQDSLQGCFSVEADHGPERSIGET